MLTDCQKWRVPPSLKLGRVRPVSGALSGLQPAGCRLSGLEYQLHKPTKVTYALLKTPWAPQSCPIIVQIQNRCSLSTCAPLVCSWQAGDIEWHNVPSFTVLASVITLHMHCLLQCPYGSASICTSELKFNSLTSRELHSTEFLRQRCTISLHNAQISCDSKRMTARPSMQMAPHCPNECNAALKLSKRTWARTSLKGRTRGTWP